MPISLDRRYNVDARDAALQRCCAQSDAPSGAAAR